MPTSETDPESRARNRRPRRPLVAAVVALAAAGMAPEAHAGTPTIRDPLTLAARGPGVPLGSGSWPIYGHDLANSRSAGDRGPSVTGVRHLRGAWSFRSTHGGFTCTPAVADGIVVATSSRGGVYALDAVTGRRRWSRAIDNLIYASPAISHGRVYVPVSNLGTPYILALRLRDGAQLWKRTVDRQRGSDLFGSPIVWNGAVYIGVSGGEAEDKEPDTHLRGNLVALDARTGHLRWKTYTVPPDRDGAPVWTTPAIDTRSGRLYAGTGNAYHLPAAATTDAIVVFDARTGRLLGHYQATGEDIHRQGQDPQGRDLDFGASPNLFRSPGGRPMVGEMQKSRMYWALDARTLRPSWSRAPGTTPTRFFQTTIASTAHDGRRIFGQTEEGQAFALSRSGRVLWQSPPSGERNFSPLATANGVVYAIRYDGYLDAMSALSGRRLTSIPLGAPAWGGVAVAGGWLFAVTGTGATDAGYVVAYRQRR